MTTQALGDQIMTDPDLSQQNEASAALTGGTDHSLPPVVATREAIEAARLEATELVGGSARLRPLGPPRMAHDALPEAARFSVIELARLTDGSGTCADRSSFSAAWAARMPAALPIYPRGNTIEATGSDEGGCTLRAVRFLTPVAGADVLAFYAARAREAGLGTDYSRAGDTDILEGAAGSRRYAVYLRQMNSGICEVGLVTSGF